VAVTGAARNGVFRWTDAEKALLESWSPEVLGGVSLPLELLNDDIHGTALYGAHLAKVLLQRAIKAITPPRQEQLPMQMQGERKNAATREKVWAALNEPTVLKASIPGCEALDGTVSEGMTATAAFKVGPISARFSGKVVFSEVDPPNGCVMAGEGAGGISGFAKGGARVSLVDAEAGTLLRYNVDAQAAE
jgi:carbon monoxide dehydrogenase subunit G